MYIREYPGWKRELRTVADAVTVTVTVFVMVAAVVVFVEAVACLPSASLVQQSCLSGSLLRLPLRWRWKSM